MSTTPQTKINQLLQALPPGAVYLSSWMKLKNISNDLQHRYIKSAWLTPIGTGAMIRTGDTPTLYGAMYSLNTLADKHLTIGAMSALEIHGYSHYLPMGKPTVSLSAPQKEYLPLWFRKYDWGVTLRLFTTEIFSSDTGITTTRQGVFELPISTPERAFMECLHLAPQYYDITDLYYVMEMLSILPPKNVQRLLEECRSVKVKRLFLFMAEKAHHAWFGALNLDKIDLGSGKRVIAKGGVYDKKYQITIPAELKND